jgi:hypothetical protein
MTAFFLGFDSNLYDNAVIIICRQAPRHHSRALYKPSEVFGIRMVYIEIAQFSLRETSL